MSIFYDSYNINDGNIFHTEKDKDNDGVILFGKMPGVKPEEISIGGCMDELQVTWKSKRGGKGDTKFRIGRNFDASMSKAKMNDGLLEVFIPVAQSKKMKQISISENPAIDVM